jgi:GTP-binding protein
MTMDKDAVRVPLAEFEAGAPRVDALPAPALPEIAFAGRSNVGKSSLMNSLMARKGLVRTSSTPGCTRQINLFKATLDDGLAMRLVDLPGYGYAKLSKSEKATWGPMLEGYLRERPTLRAVVIIVDARRGLEPDDQQLLEFLREPRSKVAGDAKPVAAFVVATKLDKMALNKQKPALLALRKRAGIPVLGYSAVTHAGREVLWGFIRKEAAVPPPSDEAEGEAPLAGPAGVG